MTLCNEGSRLSLTSGLKTSAASYWLHMDFRHLRHWRFGLGWWKVELRQHHPASHD